MVSLEVALSECESVKHASAKSDGRVEFEVTGFNLKNDVLTALADADADLADGCVCGDAAVGTFVADVE
jgi:hypothetical protein